MAIHAGSAQALNDIFVPNLLRHERLLLLRFELDSGEVPFAPSVRLDQMGTMAMSFGEKIPDKTVQRNVDRKMMQKGTSGSRVTATVSSGTVTIAGSIANEYERKPILRSVNNVAGVLRVIDQLRVVVKAKPQQ